MPKKKKQMNKGRKPERLVIEKNWKDAVKQALKRGNPPKPPKSV